MRSENSLSLRAEEIWFYDDRAKWIIKCIEFAAPLSDRLSKTEYAARYATHPDLPLKVRMIAMGKLAEVAFCLWRRIDPEDPVKGLDWQTQERDDGWDLVEFEWCRVDVKSSLTKLLLHPVNKSHQLKDPNKCDILIATYGNEWFFEGKPLIVIWGWVTWGRFIAEHKIAPEKGTLEGYSSIEKGSPYMELGQLDDLRTLVPYMDRNALPKTRQWVRDYQAYGIPAATQERLEEMKRRGIIR
jgi:hypothetical protein